MTHLLEKAFVEASKLPEPDQDTFARWILDELESDQRWDQAFATSATQLERLADEALAEYRAGRTKALDPEKL